MSPMLENLFNLSLLENLRLVCHIIWLIDWYEFNRVELRYNWFERDIFAFPPFNSYILRWMSVKVILTISGHSQPGYSIVYRCKWCHPKKQTLWLVKLFYYYFRISDYESAQVHYKLIDASSSTTVIFFNSVFSNTKIGFQVRSNAGRVGHEIWSKLK